VGAQPAPGQARVTTKVRTRRLALASPRTATILGVVVLVLMALSIPLAGLLHQLTILNIAPDIGAFRVDRSCCAGAHFRWSAHVAKP